VARYLSHLEKERHSCVRYRVRPPGELRDLYTDIFDETENVLYEAKGVATREAVRMALGQLLDYSRHVPGNPSLAVLLPARPSTDLVAMLQQNKIGCVYETKPGTFVNASSLNAGTSR
jgi:5-methylcytosine-specific restriction protein A